MCLINCSRNYLCIIFILLIFINISNTSSSNSVLFGQSETCSFSLNNGLTIDLSPLVSSDRPMIASSNTGLYIYHPCKEVPLKTTNVTECQHYQLCYFKPIKPTNKPINFTEVLLDKIPGNFILLAQNDEGVFRRNLQQQPEIVYKHLSSSKFIVTSYVRFECNEMIENYNLVIDKTLKNQSELTLSSKYVCVNTPHHLSGGAVFFIILIVFVALYFIGGILVLKFIRGATGIEMIPNHEFWCKLPQKAKGTKFLSDMEDHFRAGGDSLLDRLREKHCRQLRENIAVVVLPGENVKTTVYISHEMQIA